MSQYDDKQYINALQLLQDDARVSLLGLCNFDTKRMKEILSAGIKIVSNQVQVSNSDISLSSATDSPVFHDRLAPNLADGISLRSSQGEIAYVWNIGESRS